jgi:hypothetical protein
MVALKGARWRLWVCLGPQSCLNRQRRDGIRPRGSRGALVIGDGVRDFTCTKGKGDEVKEWALLVVWFMGL